MAFTLIYITHPDKETAQKIINILLEEKLIACANILPIDSCYYWEGTFQSDKEIVTIVKTRNKLAKKVEERIKDLHPYEVPAILRWKVRANKSYEKWIKAETSKH